MHPNSRVASHAAACANDQGKYWPMHEALYQHQAEWAPMKNPAGALSGYAKSVGVDVAAYDKCMGDAKYAGRIQASYDEGLKLGVAGTPNFVIGGRLYTQTMPSDSVRAIVLRSLPQPVAPAKPQ
jgi:protein-disulfide isomerase